MQQPQHLLAALGQIADRARTFADLFDGFNDGFTSEQYDAWHHLGRALEGLDDQLEEAVTAPESKLRPIKSYGSRRAIVNQLLIAGRQWTGLTCNEMESKHRLNLPHQTASSACTWLRNAGWIEDAGQRRMSQFGKPTTVWRLTDAALAQLRKPS